MINLHFPLSVSLKACLHSVNLFIYYTYFLIWFILTIYTYIYVIITLILCKLLKESASLFVLIIIIVLWKYSDLLTSSIIPLFDNFFWYYIRLITWHTHTFVIKLHYINKKIVKNSICSKTREKRHQSYRFNNFPFNGTSGSSKLIDHFNKWCNECISRLENIGYCYE